VLKEFAALNASEASVKEETAPPPSPRCNSSWTAHPHKDELLLFGGEHYDGKRNLFFNELFRYLTKKGEWRKVTSGVMPPPRSSHQAVAVPSGHGLIFVFGGEFSSANQASLSPRLFAYVTRPIFPTRHSAFFPHVTPHFSCTRARLLSSSQLGVSIRQADPVLSLPRPLVPRSRHVEMGADPRKEWALCEERPQDVARQG